MRITSLASLFVFQSAPGVSAGGDTAAGGGDRGVREVSIRPRRFGRGRRPA